MEILVASANNDTNSAVGEYLQLADYVFLGSKGRTGTILGRYPAIFDGIRHENIVLALVDNRVAGGVIIRPFEFQSAEILNCAMVGFVCVSPKYQGCGIGQRMLEYVSEVLRRRSMDYCVLWTTIHSFYERFGWRVRDDGIFGTYLSGAVGCSLPPLSAEDSFKIEQIRDATRLDRVIRSSATYKTVPPYVEAMHCIFAGNSRENEAYALIGTSKESCVLYEMVGCSECFPCIWTQLELVRPRILINQTADDPSYVWMTGNLNVDWLQQRQAMWLPVDSNRTLLPDRSINIPYFDRI